MKKDNPVSRRQFMQVSGAMAAGGVLTAVSGKSSSAAETKEKQEPAIRKYATLGRTGFKVSDISYGCGRIKEPNLIRYGVDKGVNYFDTAEGYMDGESERTIGKALDHIDRKKIFLTTKLELSQKDDKASILARFNKCQERLKTDYVDALFMHAVPKIADLNNAAFHAAGAELKAQGRLKHIGISCHEPEKADKMEDICIAAAEDGRFDLMLFVYNFMNKESGERILAACKKNNVGTVAMKTAPASLRKPTAQAYSFPDNLPARPEQAIQETMKKWKLTREQAAEATLDYMMKDGLSREAAIESLLAQPRGYAQQGTRQDVDAFIQNHNVKSEKRLREASVQWVLRNPDMHSTCVSMGDFETIDRYTHLSGSKLAALDKQFLGEYTRAFNDQDCRLGCNECVSSCPSEVPVSTIMRYSYYFNRGWEKRAMEKYRALGSRNATPCITCEAPCESACPYGLGVRIGLLGVDSELSLA